MAAKPFFPLTNDALFHAFFARHQTLLLRMLESVLGRKIASLTVLNLDFALPRPKPVIARAFHGISAVLVLGLAVLALRAFTPDLPRNSLRTA